MKQVEHFSKMIFSSVILSFAFVLSEVYGHGMMLDPPNRSSLWRFNDSFPENYNDNENFCGGFSVQWSQNGGKCGPCGDNYIDPIPRKNENTGKYGLGYVVAEYKSGTVINITSLLTANHRGSFTYSLCVLKDFAQPETEECFIDLPFIDGSYAFKIEPSAYFVLNSVVLPPQLTCERCVLRWHYKTGNSWGMCDDGTGAIGCGPQETFRSCSDISIA